MFFKRAIPKMLETSSDEATRNVIAQQHRVHEIKLVLAQAEAALQVYERRELELRATVARNAKDAE